jgi:hypothetical protein
MLARMMVSAHLSCVFLQVAYRSCHFPIIRPSHQNVEFQFKIIDILSLEALIWKKGRFEPATQTCNSYVDSVRMIRSMTMPALISETRNADAGGAETGEVGRISRRGVSNATGVAVERDPERCERAEPSGREFAQSIE